METNRKKLLILLGAIATQYGYKLDPSQADLYCELLKDFTFEQVKAAATHLLKTEKFFPKLCQFYEILTASSPEDLTNRAEAAWQEVLTQIDREGYYGKPSFIDPLIRQIIPFGQWPSFCLSTRVTETSLDFKRRAFIESYKARAKSIATQQLGPGKSDQQIGYGNSESSLTQLP